LFADRQRRTMPNMKSGLTAAGAVANSVARRRLRRAIHAARERVRSDTPFSPSWDASMAALEDLQREYRIAREDESPAG
jgi:hypothetical protein